MLTDFGKMCRKIRIDNDEILAEMAEYLGVTSSFLSAVENGKKNAPEGWIDLIKKRYELANEQCEKLQEAQRNSQKQVKINLENVNNEDRKIIMAFARSFDKLGNADKEKISKVLAKDL